MNKFVSHTPRKVHPPLYEYSSLRTQRDDGSPMKLWPHLRDQAKAINSLTENFMALQRELHSMHNPLKQGFDMFPFKLYTIADCFRPTNDSGSYIATANWRTFKVRSGYVLTSTVETSSMVQGTDMMDWPDSNNLPQPFDKGDSLVPENTPKYWFWININDVSIPPSYMVDSGSDPSVGSWDTFPNADSNNIPIGYVDTQTSGSVHQALVRQFLRTDVLQAGSGSSGGDEFSVCRWID